MLLEHLILFWSPGLEERLGYSLTAADSKLYRQEYDNFSYLQRQDKILTLFQAIQQTYTSRHRLSNLCPDSDQIKLIKEAKCTRLHIPKQGLERAFLLPTPPTINLTRLHGTTGEKRLTYVQIVINSLVKNRLNHTRHIDLILFKRVVSRHICERSPK